MTFDERIAKLNDMLAEAKHIVIFTGAGVSTSAGIPDFRSPNGLYNTNNGEFKDFSPEYLLSKQCLNKHTDVFFSHLQKRMYFPDVVPTITHHQIAALGKTRDVTVITQNIDSLHQDAGSEKIYTLHGTLSSAHCTECDKEYDGNIVYEGGIPRCPDCGHVIRPDVTLYGESLPADAMEAAMRATWKADLFIIVGSSMEVSPANRLPYYFYGKNFVIINRSPVRLEPMSNLVFYEDCDEVFANITIPTKEETE